MSQCEIGLEERLHCSDIFPIAFKDMRAEFLSAEQARNDFLTEISHRIIECFNQRFAVENIDTHRSQTVLLTVF